MNGLGARSRKARAAALFSKVNTSDKQGRAVKVLLPGSEAKQYEVILRRNGHLSGECNLVTALGRQPCEGNRVTVCYHVMAAVIVAARATDSQVSFCDKREHAETLAHLGHTVYPVESWNAGPGRGLWVAVKGRRQELNPQAVTAIEPQPDEVKSEVAVESLVTDWPKVMDTPAFRVFCEATVRADEAERAARRGRAEMRKRIRMPVKTAPTAPVPLTFTVEEVFAWVCQKQGVKNPDHLTDARWYSLRYMAEQTTGKLNTLFAAKMVEA